MSGTVALLAAVGVALNDRPVLKASVEMLARDLMSLTSGLETQLACAEASAAALAEQNRALFVLVDQWRVEAHVQAERARENEARLLSRRTT